MPSGYSRVSNIKIHVPRQITIVISDLHFPDSPLLIDLPLEVWIPIGDFFVSSPLITS